MTYTPKRNIWKGSPSPPSPADCEWLQGLLSGVRKLREQATQPRPSPAKPDHKGGSTQ